MFRITTVTASLLVLLICLPKVARAATISGQGIVQNQPAWHSTSVSKPFTVAGQSTYGADGYVIFGADDNTAANQFGQPWATNFAASNDNGTTVYQDAAFVNGLPSYISNLDPGGEFDSANWGSIYADGDDPRLPAGPTVADTSLGAIAGPTNQTPGDENHLLSFTIGPGVPDTLRVGVMYGNINDFFTPTAVRLSQDGGPGDATIGSIPVAGFTIDWAFFDITGAQSGDTFDIFGTVRNRDGSGNNRTAIGGITFDTVASTIIPEPQTYLLGLLGAIGVAFVVRRRRVECRRN